jgi:hypothetical protein
MEQGIGPTQVPYVLDGAFASGLNDGFDLLTMDV